MLQKNTTTTFPIIHGSPKLSFKVLIHPKLLNYMPSLNIKSNDFSMKTTKIAIIIYSLIGCYVSFRKLNSHPATDRPTIITTTVLN